MQTNNLIELNEDRFFFLFSIGLAIIFFIYQIVKDKKDKKKIALGFIENKCFSLFSKSIDTIAGLEIKFNKKPISNNLIFYQATIYNSGVSDIPDMLIYKPLTLSLPADFQWKSFNLFDKSDGIGIQYTINDTELQLSWDLLKKNEFFRFDAIIEGKKNENEMTEPSISTLAKRISFNGTRISDLQVEKQNIRYYESLLRWAKTLIHIALTFFFLIMILTLTNKTYKVVYDVNLHSVSNPVEFNFDSNKQVYIVDSKDRTIILDTLKSDLKILNTSVIEKDEIKDKIRKYGYPVMGLCVLGMIILMEQKRIRNKREKLNLVSPGNWNPYTEEDC